MAQPLLLTKLYLPPEKPGLVTRSRLLQKLDAGLERGARLTLISAPAGYGKTTLLREWFSSPGFSRAAPPFKIAWLSLDAGDNDPARFLHYFAAALLKADPGFKASMTGLLEMPGSLPVDGILAALVNDLAASEERFLFVLDDYHALTALAIHQWMDGLIESQPPNLHLVIVTRTDPLLKLSRLRARGLLTEIRSEDLRFSMTEAGQFLSQTMGLNLQRGEIEALGERTEGWAAGLQLAALSLEGEERPAERIRAFSGTDRYVVDYLLEEVLARQPESVHRFLLKTSVLERLCAPLCQAVLDEDPLDSQALLEDLERSNLFLIPLDNQRQWYRYHHLFADLLRQRLARTLGKEEARQARLKASRWFEENGFNNEAVELAIAAGDSSRLIDLLERHGLQILQSRSRPLPESWLAAVDPRLAEDRPMFCVVAVYSELFGRVDPPGVVEGRIQTAERALARSGAEDSTARGLLAAAKAATLRMRSGDPDEIIREASLAMELLPEDAWLGRFNAARSMYSALMITGETARMDEFIDEAARYSRAAQYDYYLISSYYSKAHVAVFQGRLRDAERICLSTLDELVAPALAQGKPFVGAGEIYFWLGWIALERGDLEGARQHFQLAADDLRYLAEIYIRMRTAACLARIAWIQGQYDRAGELLQQAEATWSGAGRYVGAVQARLRLMRGAKGDLEQAERWAQGVHLDAGDERRMRSMLLDGEWHFLEQMTLARVLLARRRAGLEADLDGLLRALRLQERIAGECGWGDRLVETRLLQGLALAEMKDSRGAASTLLGALELGEPQCYRRVFVDEGRPLQALLLDLRARPEGKAVMSYINELLAAFPAEEVEPRSEADRQRAAGLVEPLSERELEVLRLIADGLSNAEIAQKLFLSPNTLKAHTQSIYGKLDVHSRVQAVNRARELGLI